jgi:hypothetical protein
MSSTIDLTGRKSAQVPLGGLDLDGHEHLSKGVLEVPAPPVAFYLGLEDNDVGDGLEAAAVPFGVPFVEVLEVLGRHGLDPDLNVHPELPGRNSSAGSQAVVEERLVVELRSEHGPAFGYEGTPGTRECT